MFLRALIYHRIVCTLEKDNTSSFQSVFIKVRLVEDITLLFVDIKMGHGMS